MILTNFSVYVDLVPLILLAAAGVSATLLIVSISLWNRALHIQLWALSGVAGTGGLLLIALRGQVPEWVSILPGNLLVLGGYVLLSGGTLLSVGRTMGSSVAVGAVFGIGFAVAFALGADLDLRVALMSAALIAFCVLVMLALAPHARRLPVKFALVVIGFTVMLGIVRIVSALGVLETLAPRHEIDSLALRLGVISTLGIASALAWMSWQTHGQVSAPPSAARLAGGWRLATDRRALVMPTGTEVRLTGNELMVLQKLVANDEPVARNDLNAVIGRDTENPKDRGVDILISRLRRKCDEAGAELPIVAVRGRGYVFHGGLELA